MGANPKWEGVHVSEIIDLESSSSSSSVSSSWHSWGSSASGSSITSSGSNTGFNGDSGSRTVTIVRGVPYTMRIIAPAESAKNGNSFFLQPPQPQSQLPQSPQGMGSLNRKSTGPVGTDGLLHHCGFDKPSASGKLTYHVIPDPKAGNQWGSYNIPLTFRNTENGRQEYVPTRVLEYLFLPRFNMLFTAGYYFGPKIQSFPLTQLEANNWTYINTWHNDGVFGTKPFTTNDYLIAKEDAVKLYQFLSFTHDVLASKGHNKSQNFNHCGYIEFQNNKIPFAVTENGNKVLPLFYIDSPPKELEAKAFILQDDWAFAYFRLLFKLQSIKPEVYSPAGFRVFDSKDFKQHFPPDFEFNEAIWADPNLKISLPAPTKISKNLPNGLINMAEQSFSSQWTQRLPNEGNFSVDEANHQLSLEIKSNTNVCQPDKEMPVPRSTLVVAKTNVQGSFANKPATNLCSTSKEMLGPRRKLAVASRVQSDTRVGILRNWSTIPIRPKPQVGNNQNRTITIPGPTRILKR